MKSALTAALVLVGSLGAASAAMAATHAVPPHHAHRVVVMRSEPIRSPPVKVMSETPNPDPGLAGVFQATDGVIYAPVTHDSRSHGLPNY